jgi:hypothetical protein
MTRILLIALLTGAVTPAFAQASLAPTPVPKEPACLRPINLYDFKPVPGNRSLIVIDRARLRYRVNFMGICSNLQYHLNVAFKSRGAGNLTCVSRGDSVIVNDVVTPSPCFIKDIEYQTVAMDQADAAAAAAKKGN